MILDQINLPDGKLASLMPYQEALLGDIKSSCVHAFVPPRRRSGTSILLYNYILAHAVQHLTSYNQMHRGILIVSENVQRSMHVRDSVLELASTIDVTSPIVRKISNVFVLESWRGDMSRAIHGIKYSLVFFNGARNSDMHKIRQVTSYVCASNPNAKCIIEMCS